MNKFLAKNAQPLKIVSLVIGLAGAIVASELQRRETREMVEEILAERDAPKNSPEASK